MSTAPLFLGLTGYKGSGKDLVAALLTMRGFTRFGFADALREEVENSFVHPPIMPDHIFYEWVECQARPESLYEKPMLPHARHILQWWGTEYRRKENPYYWIDKMEAELEHFNSSVVISDVRFQNEADWIEKWGGKIWLIDRPGCKSDGHQSETELEKIEPDYIILNNGDLQTLAHQVLRGLEYLEENETIA